jgi:hypothetical protein
MVELLCVYSVVRPKMDGHFNLLIILTHCGISITVRGL